MLLADIAAKALPFLTAACKYLQRERRSLPL
jgi:hypothetical protein